MKRPPHHFVVEVRRPRRSTTTSTKSWLEDPRFAAATGGGFDDAPLAAEAAFAVAPAAPAAPARPQGRILQSLAEPEAPVEIEEPPRRRRRKSEIDGGIAEHEEALPKAARLRPAEPPPPAKTRAVRKKPKIVAKASDAPASPAPPMRDDAAVAALAKVLAARALGETRPEPSDDPTLADRAEARQARHRRILERYVHGAPLKPGERWKRRLQKGRK